MKQFWVVLKTYFRRWQFWLWGAMWGCQIGGYIGLLANKGRPGALLATALGFGIGYSWAGIGVQLKEQLGSYRSDTMPGFRAPHIAVAVCWCVVTILPFAILPTVYNQSVLGALALGLPLGSAALAGACLGSWRIGAFIVPYGALFCPPVSGLGYRFVAGDFTLLAIVLCGLGLWWTVHTFLFLLRMTEEDPEFSFRIRTNVASMRGPNARRAMADAMAQLDRRHSIWLRPIDWMLPDHRIFAGDTHLHRIKQWRRANANWMMSAVMPAFIWTMMAGMHFLMNNPRAPTNAIWGAIWVLPMLPQMTFLGSWQARAGVLEREMVYPLKRRDFVLENAASVLLVQYVSWLLVVIPFGAAAIYTCGLTATQVVTTAVISGSWQLVGFSLNARLATGRSSLPMYFGAVGNGLVGTIVLIGLVKVDLPLLSAGAVSLIAVAAWFLLHNAYEHWITIDIV